jgi:hypothetical protein
MWGWLICGLFMGAIIFIDLYGAEDDEIKDRLSPESGQAFEMIGGKTGTVLIAILLGPIGLIGVIMERGE